MYCKKCGNEIEESNRFCPYCGQDQQGSIQRIQAPPEPEKTERGGTWKILLPIGCVAGAAIIGFIFFYRNGKTGAAVGQTVLERAETASNLTDMEVTETEEVRETETREETEIFFPEVEEAVREVTFRYEIIITDCSWSEALAQCIARGGRLAVLDTEEKYRQVLDKLEGFENYRFWIGAKRNGTYEEYHWVNADETLDDDIINANAQYRNYWLDGEPSFLDANLNVIEDCVCVYFSTQENRWVWNDIPNDVLAVAGDMYAGKLGYIIEYTIENWE